MSDEQTFRLYLRGFDMTELRRSLDEWVLSRSTALPKATRVTYVEKEAATVFYTYRVTRVSPDLMLELHYMKAKGDYTDTPVPMTNDAVNVQTETLQLKAPLSAFGAGIAAAVSGALGHRRAAERYCRARGCAWETAVNATANTPTA